MKHLTTVASVLTAALALIALVFLATDRTALIAAGGLRKVVTAAAVLTVASLVVRLLLGMVERRDHRRWTVCAHPLAWLLAVPTLIAALGLTALVVQRAERPRFQGNWAIGLYLSAGTVPTDFTPTGRQPILTADDVTDIPCAFVADPVLVADDDGYTIFFEAWHATTGQGDICIATSRDGERWEYGGRVLDEECSVSYPTVFRHEGTWYMVPETRALDELRLYRAEAYPDRWVFDRILLDGAPYRDTNLFERGGRWYLFTTADYGADLLVFHAESPLGPWRPHPANPVVRDDLDHARGGGSIHVVDGTVWRFVQDVHPYYGNRVRRVRVEDLSPTSYRQVPADAEPELVGQDAWNVQGMHTLWAVQRDDGRWLAAVDGYGLLVDTKPGWFD